MLLNLWPKQGCSSTQDKGLIPGTTCESLLVVSPAKIWLEHFLIELNIFCVFGGINVKIGVDCVHLLGNTVV